MSRLLISLLVLSALAAPAAAGAASHGATVSMRVTAGYDSYYRESAWVPVRTRLHNLTAGTVDGSLIVQGAADRPRAPRYVEQVVLPPGARKQVTLYIPGTDVQGEINAAYRTGGSPSASAAVFPNPYADTDFVLGALSDNTDNTAWLRGVHPQRSRLRVVPLSGTSLDTLSLALATFDAILLTNSDSSRLDGDQISALEQYVRNGGSLILVGGPDWQETLSSLPAELLPGRLIGTQTLPNLDALRALGHGVPPHHILSSARLSRARGAVLASERGVPLVVKAGLGDGQIEYLAFDPSDAEVASWAGSGPFLTVLVTGAAPLSTRRPVLLPVDRATSFLDPGPEPLDISAELSNLSTPPLATVLVIPLIVFISLVLAVAGILFILRRWRRIAWIGIPVVVAMCAAVAVNLAPVARRAAVINTINVVLMNGGSQHSADRYVALLSPLSGDYTLTYSSPAAVRDMLPAHAFTFESAGPGPATFTEGARTEMTLPNVQTWTTRAVAMRTTMSVPGRIDTRLRLNGVGDLVGTVANHTTFTLKRPAVVAGHAYTRLPNIGPGSRVRVTVHPVDDVRDHQYPQMLTRVYGETLPDYAAMASQRLPSLPGSPAGIPPDRDLRRRIQNAVSALPESHLLTTLGEVTLVAWTDRSLDSVELDGSQVNHRDLTLLIQPVSVTLSRGRFRLPTGVEGAQAVEVDPTPPQYSCCGPTIQPISFGAGGSATFAFDLPKATYRELALDVYAGGADTTASGYTDIPDGSASAYDWRANRWVPLHFVAATSRFVNPIRFISYTGTVLLRLQATRRSGDLSILDPRQDLQLHGAGTAS